MDLGRVDRGHGPAVLRAQPTLRSGVVRRRNRAVCNTPQVRRSPRYHRRRRARQIAIPLPPPVSTTRHAAFTLMRSPPPSRTGPPRWRRVQPCRRRQGQRHRLQVRILRCDHSGNPSHCSPFHGLHLGGTGECQRVDVVGVGPTQFLGQTSAGCGGSMRSARPACRRRQHRIAVLVDGQYRRTAARCSRTSKLPILRRVSTPSAAATSLPADRSPETSTDRTRRRR